MLSMQANNYYSELRQSVDDLHALGIQVVTALNFKVPRDEYNGLIQFDEWRDGGFDPLVDPDHFGLQGDEIVGEWIENGSVFHGFFPVIIDENGEPIIQPWHLHQDAKAISKQIDIAEEFNIQLGIASGLQPIHRIIDANILAINATIESLHPDVLRIVANNQDIRIEFDGKSFRAYCHLDKNNEHLAGFFADKTDRLFSFANQDYVFGAIRLDQAVPAYPSNVLGHHIQLVSRGQPESFIRIPSLEAAGIHFEVALPCTQDQCYEADLEDLNQEQQGCPEPHHWPVDDEDVFQKSVIQFEKTTKPSKEVKRLPPINQESSQNINRPPHFDLALDEFLPQPLAESLDLVRENLPYDSLCVMVSFLTGVAGMLPLGTKVMGNPLTDYVVPINLYTMLIAKSGSKKSPLLKLFVETPASDVMNRMASQNAQMIEAWKQQCKGKKKNDWPSRPVPIDIRLNDYTSEAFVQALGKLDEVSRSVLIIRDEIAGLFNSLNAYKSGNGSDEQQLLELYDGGGYRSLRVGDQGRFFSRSNVNIYGTMQPRVLDKLLVNGDDNGLWARFCIVPMPEFTKQLPIQASRDKRRDFFIAQKSLRDVNSKIFSLKPLVYELCDDAMKLFSKYELGKQEDVHSARIPAQSAIHGKSAGKVLRFAGLFHILETIHTNSTTHLPISVSNLNKAIKLVDHLDQWPLSCHAKLSGVTTDGLTSFERRLHNIALKSTGPMSWSDIRQKMSSAEKQGKAVKDAEEAMSKLVSLGLGKVTKGPNGGLYYQALKPLPS